MNHKFKSEVPKILFAVYVVLIPVFLIIALYLQSRPVSSNVPFNLTDTNWQNGISRNQTAFFVLLNTKNAKDLKVGVKIKFRSGVRTITGAFETAPYLNIHLDGVSLDPEIDGYPNAYEILK